MAEIRHVLSKNLGEHYFLKYGHGNGCRFVIATPTDYLWTNQVEIGHMESKYPGEHY